jgi:aminomethyltransferase
MCNEEGGVVDDLLVYKVGEKKFYLVVNASNIDKDREWIKAHIKYGSILTDISGDVSMIAVQGPLAESLTKEIFKELPKEFYTFGYGEFNGEKILVSRTGYTGEDGFEIYAENRTIGEIFDALRAFGDKYNLMLVGLGARDTLRLESAMPLYGHEMNEETLATEIVLDKYIKFEKDEFIGKEALEKKTPEYKRIGVKITDKGIARERCAVFLGDENIGYVTSGTMSPTLGYSIGMARVRRDAKTECGGISIDVRGRRLGAQETAMPFIKK